MSNVSSESFPVRRAIAAGAALLASPALASCMYETPDYVDEAEAMAMLDDKQNPCSYGEDYKDRACDKLMDAPRLAIVYPEDSSINPEPLKPILKEFVKVATTGGVDLRISLIPVSGKEAEVLVSDDCVPDSDKTNVGEMPVVKLAGGNDKINNYDFVMALSTRSACDSETLGVSYGDVGDRLIDVYEFSNEDPDAPEDAYEDYTTAAHEIGHSILGLGHSAGDILGVDAIDKFAETQNGRRTISLDEAIKKRAPYYDYGDDDSIMGGGDLAPDEPIEAEALLTPMELSHVDVSTGKYNNDVAIDFIDRFGKATLPVGDESKFVSIDYDKDHTWSYEGEDYDDTYIGVDVYSGMDYDEYSGEPAVYFYSSIIKDGPPQPIVQARIGSLHLNQDETVDVVLEEANGKQRVLTITRTDDKYLLDVHKG